MINEQLPPTKLIISPNSISKIGEEVRPFGSNAMVVTGKQSMRKLGYLDKCTKHLEGNNIETVVFDKVSPNPTIKTIQEGTKKFSKNNCDIVIGLGGGSVIDTAKLISLSSFNNKDVWWFTENEKIKGAHPIISCPTTSGTGSHVTPYAVITNQKTKEKKTIKHPSLHPKVALYDINIAANMPQKVTASSGFDALMHAIETFTKKGDHPITDMFALNSISLISKSLINASNNGRNIKARTNMALADTYAGISLSITGTHSMHGISHPISGRKPEIMHGEALAIISTKMLKYNQENGGPQLKNKHKTIARFFGKEHLYKTVKELKQKINLNKTLTDYFNENEIKKIINDCKTYRWGSIKKNPAIIKKEKIKEIIEKCK